jgi:hypothetical protein
LLRFGRSHRQERGSQTDGERAADASTHSTELHGFLQKTAMNGEGIGSQEMIQWPASRRARLRYYVNADFILSREILTAGKLTDLLGF